MTLAAHMVGIAMECDRRHRRLLEQDEQLRQKQKLEAVGSLTGGISHEFSNLLQTITAYTDFALANAAATEQIHEDLMNVRCAAKRATSLTRQLLSFCRRHPIDRRLINLNTLVQETCNLVQPLLGENIGLAVVQDATMPEVMGDYSQLQQSLINLCINARDAMPQGGRLSIRTQAVDNVPGITADDDSRVWAMLTVQDTGVGMSSELKSRIFEPFFTTKELGKGTGLGLPVVYGIVQQHDGILDVDTAPKRGTTFRIYLPSADGDAQSTASTERGSRDCVTARNRETILVAEDDKAVRDALSRILQGAGYRIVLAQSGEDAVRLFQTHRNTLALAMLDVAMPGKGGRWAAAQIHGRCPEFPLIFCTGYDPDTVKATEALADTPTIVKPVDAEHLLRTVGDTLAKSRCKRLPAPGAIVLCEQSLAHALRATESV
jgi:nitrogen-specific signal transduction histidine kinase/FixJ family two-component response regulator